MNILVISKHQPKPYYHHHSFIIFFLVFLLDSDNLLLVAAQYTFANSDSDSDSKPFFIAGVLLSAITAFTVVVYLLIYLSYRRLYLQWAGNGPVHQATSIGLDPLVIRSFPVFLYTDEVKPSKGPLECAVCLGVFEEDETLRMLPRCGHVFHVDCVDPWLASHTTCPLCRSNLVPQIGELTRVESGFTPGPGCREGEVNEVRVDVVAARREIVVMQLGENSLVEVNRTRGEN